MLDELQDYICHPSILYFCLEKLDLTRKAVLKDVKPVVRENQ